MLKNKKLNIIILTKIITTSSTKKERSITKTLLINRYITKNVNIKNDIKISNLNRFI
jgi:hypothetical protein